MMLIGGKRLTKNKMTLEEKIDCEHILQQIQEEFPKAYWEISHQHEWTKYHKLGLYDLSFIYQEQKRFLSNEYQRLKDGLPNNGRTIP